MTSINKELPSDEELTVPHEITLSTPAMNAAATRMHQYCEPECKEFMLCRSEEKDPRACIAEGRAVTNCGIRFLQKVKNTCLEEFNSFSSCIDHGRSGRLQPTDCPSQRHQWNACINRSFGMPQPPVGYFARPHVHHTDRLLKNKERDYQSEAHQMMQHLPPDYPMRPDPKVYVDRANLDYARML